MEKKNEKKEKTKSFLALKYYLEAQNFKGWDPYDGLYSKVFQAKKEALISGAWDKLPTLSRNYTQFGKPEEQPLYTTILQYRNYFLSVKKSFI